MVLLAIVVILMLISGFMKIGVNNYYNYSSESPVDTYSYDILYSYWVYMDERLQIFALVYVTGFGFRGPVKLNIFVSRSSILIPGLYGTIYETICHCLLSGSVSVVFTIYCAMALIIKNFESQLLIETHDQLRFAPNGPCMTLVIYKIKHNWSNSQSPCFCNSYIVDSRL